MSGNPLLSSLLGWAIALGVFIFGQWAQRRSMKKQNLDFIGHYCKMSVLKLLIAFVTITWVISCSTVMVDYFLCSVFVAYFIFLVYDVGALHVQSMRSYQKR